MSSVSSRALLKYAVLLPMNMSAKLPLPAMPVCSRVALVHSDLSSLGATTGIPRRLHPVSGVKSGKNFSRKISKLKSR